jgi:MULE transposase domain
VFELDATFNTNNLGLLLFVAVGITHTERSFPAAFAFGGAEDGVIFRFFFECFKELIFINNISLSRVFVSDQALGLMIIIDDSLSNTIS